MISPKVSIFEDDDSVSEFAEALELACLEVAGDGYWAAPLPPGEYNVYCCPLEAFDIKRPGLAPSYFKILTNSEHRSFKCGYDQTDKRWVTNDGTKFDRRFWELGKAFREKALAEGWQDYA